MSSASMGRDRGVYTLANDVVIEWFEAFIRSFRKNNPDLPLTVIPYDRNMSRIRSLAEKYRFEVMEESECSKFNALADVLKMTLAGCFRKFASFFGPYREFLFLDSDIVTLVPLGPLFDAFSSSSAQFVYFDTSMEMCYKKNLAAVMVPEYGSPAYNSGAFFSSREMISEPAIWAAAEKAASISDGFAIGGEQPFLNYLTDISRVQYAGMSDLLPDIANSIWVRHPFTYNQKTDTARDATGSIMPFIHWPGYSQPLIIRAEVYLRHRTDGFSLIDRIKFKASFHFRRSWFYFLRTQSHYRKTVKKYLTTHAGKGNHPAT